ncbi:hypothetical protein N3K66_003126 [Trichothecium roseum]|uniref:Uncharacterized protein n=1 Tax=Trichothecium roseum TaxID=47278 RepID=A0ACC0V6F4_9HYPO|nr:hypothetical protein N3K66_003126 [Trichothecium roseum]
MNIISRLASSVTGLLVGGTDPQEFLLELPQGQTYLVRPLSPKGYSELIFKDSALRIRQTNQDYQYQLVVQRVFEEGEAQLLAEDEGEDAEIRALDAERDEKTFLLDEALHLRIEIRGNSEKVLAWRDLSGDTGDLWEFVCDEVVSSSEVQEFLKKAQECQFERKYRKPHAVATDADLEEFTFGEEPPIPPASPLHSPTLTHSVESIDEMFKRTTISNTSAKRQAALEDEVSDDPTAKAILGSYPCELHLYDPEKEYFASLDESCIVTVSDFGAWQYRVKIDGAEEYLDIPIEGVSNYSLNQEYLSFIFNHFAQDVGRTFLLRFKNKSSLLEFKTDVKTATWENRNETSLEKVAQKDQEYILEDPEDVIMEESESASQEEEEEEEEEDETEDESVNNELFSEDEESEGEEDVDAKAGDKNSQLAVGYKHDRSFVVRGSKIGVFKHTPNNHLEFSTNISKVQTPKGKMMNPTKVMLHSEDRDLVIQNENDPNKLYRMDLEYGKVVDEWNVHDDIPVLTFAPENKFAQMTSEQTFLGASRNALYRVDPRLSGNKLVDTEMKQYASKNSFSSLATTEKGHIALADDKGAIRLFDRLGIKAKTALPALGDPVIGMDVSADGRWILATLQKSILLIDAKQKSGKNEGKLGFEKPFSADQKPEPRRLTLTPQHTAQFFHETGKDVTFTPAKFNTGRDGAEETSIITATGPYIIEWSMRKILARNKDPYRIKRYEEQVMADDFKFGTDKNVIVALPNQVNMVAKQALKRPTRESIAGNFTTPRKSSGRIGTGQSGRYKLGRDDIVDSPY